MFLKRLKSKSGMTLIEVLVAFMVSMIVLIGAYSILLPTIKNWHYNNDLADAKNTSSLILSTIQYKIEYAETLDIKPGSYTGSGGTSYNTIYQDDTSTPTRFLMMPKSSTTEVVLLSNSYFKELNYKITYTIATGSSSALEVHIEVNRIGNPKLIYQTKGTIVLLNMRDAGGILKSSTTGGVAGDYIEFALPTP